MTTLDELKNPEIQAQQWDYYVNNRTGMYSSTPSTLVFVPLQSFMSSDDFSNITQELDEALASSPAYNTSGYSLERMWLDDEMIPQIEMVLFPGWHLFPFIASPAADHSPSRTHFVKLL